jgi:hypothetical protein
VVLNGFRVHGSYWDSAATGEHSCFVPLVERLYAEDLILSNAPAGSVPGA